MIERIGVTESDLHRLLALVDPARCGEPGDYVPNSLLDDLAVALGSDLVSVQVMDPYSRTWEGEQLSEGGVQDNSPEILELFWPAFWEAFSYHQRSGDIVSVTRRTDPLPGVRLGPHWEALREVDDWLNGCWLSVPLFLSRGMDRRLLIFRRAKEEFTDRQVMLLTLLRPHLMELYRRQCQALAGVPVLTRRQWEILELLGSGASNRQVAHSLNVSEGTVRKHLENIYARLDVTSRTEALAKTNEFLDRPTTPRFSAPLT